MLALYSYGTRAMNEVSLLYTSLPDRGLVEQWSSTPFHPAEPPELMESCFDLDPCGALRTVCMCLCVGVCVRVCLSSCQPLWMYFLITTQPCLNRGHGRFCRRVHVFMQGSKVSMLPSAGPSLLTMPPVV